MHLIVQGITSHDRSGTNSCRNPSPCGEVYQYIDIFKYYIYSQNYRRPHEGYTVSSVPTPILYYPNSSLNFRDVLVSTRQVNHRTTRHFCN